MEITNLIPEHDHFMNQLVDYDSSEEEEAVTNEVSGDKQPPPLPLQFLDLYRGIAIHVAYLPVKPKTFDDPAFHQGRFRSEPHQGGLWPTHISLDCKKLEKIMKRATKRWFISDFITNCVYSSSFADGDGNFVGKRVR